MAPRPRLRSSQRNAIPRSLPSRTGDISIRGSRRCRVSAPWARPLLADSTDKSIRTGLTGSQSGCPSLCGLRVAETMNARSVPLGGCKDHKRPAGSTPLKVPPSLGAVDTSTTPAASDTYLPTALHTIPASSTSFERIRTGSPGPRPDATIEMGEVKDASSGVMTSRAPLPTAARVLIGAGTAAREGALRRPSPAPIRAPAVITVRRVRFDVTISSDDLVVSCVRLKRAVTD